jgi:dihydrofolate reductase
MRKVILSIAMSIDGYIARRDGKVDWLQSIPNPGKIDYGFAEFYKTVDTTIMGNNTYKEILGFDIPFPFMDKENFVFSRSGRKNDSHVTFISGSPITLVNTLKERQGGNIWLIGGGQINKAFLDNHLIDEMLLRVVPVVIGDGLPLFPQITDDTLFTLLKVETFSTGTVQMTYAARH